MRSSRPEVPAGQVVPEDGVDGEVLLGEVEEWHNLLPFAGAMIAMTGLCLGTFSIAALLELAIHIAADVHAQER